MLSMRSASLLLTFLLMSTVFYMYIIVIQYIYIYIYIYIFFFSLFSMIGYYKILSRVPCAVH